MAAPPDKLDVALMTIFPRMQSIFVRCRLVFVGAQSMIAEGSAVMVKTTWTAHAAEASTMICPRLGQGLRYYEISDVSAGGFPARPFSRRWPHGWLVSGPLAVGDVGDMNTNAPLGAPPLSIDGIPRLAVPLLGGSAAFVNVGGIGPMTATSTRVTPFRGMDDVAPSPVRITVNRWPLLAIVVAIGVAAGSTLWVFSRGVVIESYDGSHWSERERYDKATYLNSMSANVSTFVARTFDFLCSMVLPVVFLCLFTTLVMDDRGVTKRLILWGMGAAVSYAVTIGFGALYVQLENQPVLPVISLEDLSFQPDVHADSDKTDMSTAVTDTVLRNALRPPVINPKPVCEAKGDYMSRRWFGAMSSYGFTLREWQSKMIPRAIENTSSYSLSINPAAPIDRKAWLPMNLSIASHLIVHALTITDDLFSNLTGATSSPLNIYDVPFNGPEAVPFPVSGPDDMSNLRVIGTYARLFNLTAPTDPVGADFKTNNVQHFLKRTRQLTADVFNRANDTINTSDMAVKFTKVAVADDMTFESVTFDVSLSGEKLRRFIIPKHANASNEHSFYISNVTELSEDPGQAKRNKTSVLELAPALECGPKACVLTSKSVTQVTLLSGNNGISWSTEDSPIDPMDAFFPAGSIRALALCANDNGTEDLVLVNDFRNISSSTAPEYWRHPQCSRRTNNSMLVVSFGKRVEGGEALVEKAKLGALGDRAVFQDVRKVYTITVGRLSWKTKDLKQAYQAQPSSPNEDYNGLNFPLRGDLTKHLVIGRSKLPLHLLSPYAYKYSGNDAKNDATELTEWMQLVEVRPDSKQKLHGDVISPKHFKNVSWVASKDGLSGASCSAEAENVINHLELNHLYIDGDGVQEAYTAGLFFLFQDAVELKTIQSGNMLTLAFANNIQKVDAIALIPPKSAVISAIGIGVLAWTALIVMLMGKPQQRALETKLTAHSVARIIINDREFPPLLLSKSMADEDAADGEALDLAKHRIGSVVLSTSHGSGGKAFELVPGEDDRHTIQLRKFQKEDIA